MLEGSEFQVVAAATEKARRATPVLVLGATSSGVSDDCRCRTGTVVWIRSLRYAGVEDDDTLNVSCGKSTKQDGVAVVQPGSDDTASHCLSEVVSQQTTHVACVVIARPRYDPGVTVEPQLRADGDAEGLQLRCNLQPAACDLGLVSCRH